MLMLLCVHVTSVLFLVLAGNSTLLRFYVVTRSYSSCPFLCALGVVIKGVFPSSVAFCFNKLFHHWVSPACSESILLTA